MRDAELLRKLKEYRMFHDSELSLPFFEEFCRDNNMLPDEVLERARGSKKIKKEIDLLNLDRMNLLQRGAMTKKLDKAFCIFALKQMGWRETVEVDKKTTIDFNGDIGKWAK